MLQSGYENLLMHAVYREELCEEFGSTYEADLETATDDQIRSWLYSLDITADDIEANLEAGETLLSIAEEQERQGYIFSI